MAKMGIMKVKVKPVKPDHDNQGGNRNNSYGSNNGGWNNRGGYNGSSRGQYGGQRSEPKPPIEPKSLPDNFLDLAEELLQKEFSSISTSKIRRLYSLSTEIYDRERLSTAEEISADSKAALSLMRVRIAYECGRDNDVENFVSKANILQYLKGLGTKRKDFINFNHYMEALVAYHRYFGGREN